MLLWRDCKMPKRRKPSLEAAELTRMVDRLLVAVKRLEIRLNELRARIAPPEKLKHERRLPPVTASAYLRKKHRLKYSPQALAVMRSEGDGPPFHKDASRVFYRAAELDEWAAGIVPNKRNQIVRR